MDGEDFAEDIIVDGVGIGISMGTGIGVAALTTKILTGVKVGASLAGTIGAVAAVTGIVVVGIAEYIYGNKKDDVHNAIENIEDWWEQCWW